MELYELANKASDFKTIDRRSLNIVFIDADERSKVVGSNSNEIYYEHLLVGNLSKTQLLSIRSDPRILTMLRDDDEKTLAVHLYEVILNDPLRTGIQESLTDSFVDTLLRDLRFGKYPLTMKLQTKYTFEVGSIRVSARPEFSIEKDCTVLFFDEDKHIHGKIRPSNEYGECQMAGEAIACAYRNFADITSSRREQDQIIYATRVIGTRFTFYKAFISATYLLSLAEGLPPSSEVVEILRFPRSDSKEYIFGYDYADNNQRPIILEMLTNLKNTLLNI